MFFAYRGWSIIFIAPIFAVSSPPSAAATPHAGLVNLYGKAIITSRRITRLSCSRWLHGYGAGDDTAAGKQRSSRFLGDTARGHHYGRAAQLQCPDVRRHMSVFFASSPCYVPLRPVRFKQADIPKRLLPGLLARWRHLHYARCCPGTPQIRTVIPVRSFGTST